MHMSKTTHVAKTAIIAAIALTLVGYIENKNEMRNLKMCKSENEVQIRIRIRGTVQKLKGFNDKSEGAVTITPSDYETIGGKKCFWAIEAIEPKNKKGETIGEIKEETKLLRKDNFEFSVEKDIFDFLSAHSNDTFDFELDENMTNIISVTLVC